MVKKPQDPSEIFQEIIDDYKKIFANDLVSIILYGSATGRDYRPGKSDINFMIVLSEEGIENLDCAFDTVQKWRKSNVAIPLFLTEVYVETSMDVYPIEYLNFQGTYSLIYGKDILKDLSFNTEFVRLQCEREIKGKLLLLRKAFIETAGKGKALKSVISQSLPAFIAIFKALLYLEAKEVPSVNREIVRNTCESFELDFRVYEKLLDIKEEKYSARDAEIKDLYKQYLREIRRLGKILDTWGGKDE